MTIHKGFDINTASTPKPWGAREEAAIKDIIDTLVGDALVVAKATGGHKHPRMYNINGLRVFDTGTSPIYVVAERDILSHGNDGYNADGDLARFAAVAGEQNESQAGMLLEYGYGLRLSVFGSLGTGKMGVNTYDAIRIHERGDDKDHPGDPAYPDFTGGEVGIMTEPQSGIALKVGGVLKVTDTAMITPMGGFAVKVKASGAITAGQICKPVSYPGIFSPAGTSLSAAAMPQGVAYSGAADDEDFYLVTDGIVEVLPHAGVTAAAGYWIYASDAEAGRVMQSSSVPTTVAELLRKVGRFIDNGTGVGVKTRAIVHF